MKQTAIHIFFWTLYIVSEYFANLMHLQPGRNWQFFQATLLTLPVLLIATYFMALFVLPRYLKTNKWLQFILWTIVTAAFVFFGRIKWLELVNYIQFNEYSRVPAAKVLKNIIRDYSIIALAICIYILGDYKRKQKLNEELIKSKAEAEIKLLKGQLHPHFLFNSLNNIYSLALMKSDLTADSILKLTELLDYLVYRANQEKVALAKEVELLDNYLGLEQLRYGEKLKIQSDTSIKNENIQIAPLLLLPFAENCFKHGGIGNEGVFHIELELHSDEKKLMFQIKNSKNKGKKTSNVSGGVGLQNIRKRLTLLYPGKHQLNMEDLPLSYKVKLEITFKNENL